MLAVILVCVVFCIIFICGVLLTYSNFKNRYGELSHQENLAVSFGCNTVILAVCAMLLAFVGAFRLRYLMLSYLFICGGLFIFVQRNAYKKIGLKEVLCGKLEKPLLVILILAGVLYLSFPTYYMWSGRDYGIYVIHAMHTAQTGKIVYEADQWLNENYEQLDEVIEIGYPAFYSSYEAGLSEKPGEINPQFLPLYWCLLAIGYNLAGIEGLVRITAFLSLITLSVFYFFLKHFAGNKAAVAGTLLLAICPAQIWGARITQSEQMAQLLFVLTAFLFALGWEKNKNALLYLATAILGIGSFCRMDNYVLGLGIICMGIYATLFNKQKKRAVFWCVIQYLTWFVVTLAYMYFIHPGYFWDHWERDVLRNVVYGNVAFFIVYFVVWIICRLKKIEWSGFIFGLSKNKKTGIVVFSLALFYILLFYFVRPLLSEHKFADSLRQYSFYFSPVLLLFVAVGAGKILRASDREEFERKVEPLFLFLGMGMISALLYTYRPSITMDHFFMSRRWIPANFPIFFFIAAVGFFYLYDKRINKKAVFYLKQSILLLAGGFMLLYIVCNDRVLMKEPAYGGIEEDYAEIVDNLPQDGVILTDKAGIAGMIRYGYGQRIYLTCEEADIGQLSDYMEAGNTVYYMGNLYTSDIFWGMDGELIYSGLINGNAPECSIGYYPKEIQEFAEDINLYSLTAKKGEYCNLIPAVQVFDESIRGQDKIELLGTGCVFFGPYRKLSEGSYELYVRMEGENLSNEKIGVMEIVIDEEVVYSEDIRQSDIPICIPFELTSEAGVFQTRFIKTCEEDARCVMLRLCR